MAQGCAWPHLAYGLCLPGRRFRPPARASLIDKGVVVVVVGSLLARRSFHYTLKLVCALERL